MDFNINSVKALRERANSQPVSSTAKECFDLAASIKDCISMAWIARELWDWDDAQKNRLLHQKLKQILSFAHLSEEEQKEVLENDSIRYYSRRDFSIAGVSCCMLSVFEVEKMLQLTKKLIPYADEATSRLLARISSCCDVTLDAVLIDLVKYLDSIITSRTGL